MIYYVNVPFSGYSRGYFKYEIEASTEEEAIERVEAYEGTCVDEVVIRDDRDTFFEDARAQETCTKLVIG